METTLKSIMLLTFMLYSFAAFSQSSQSVGSASGDSLRPPYWSESKNFKNEIRSPFPRSYQYAWPNYYRLSNSVNNFERNQNNVGKKEEE